MLHTFEMKKCFMLQINMALILLSLWGQPITSTSDVAHPKRPPNLVFIMSDQHSYDMVGWHKGSQAITPNLSRLAQKGIIFNHAVSTSPQCTPFRGILMSGMHAIRNGAINNDIRMLSSEQAGHPGAYFAEQLEKQGYRTGYIGKWHLYGGNRARAIPPGAFRYGFNETFLSNNCTLTFDAGKAYWWDSAGNREYHDVWEPFGQSMQAQTFISEQDDRPFALFIAYHPPHDLGSNNYKAPAEYMDIYDISTISIRPNSEDNIENRIRYKGHLAMITGLDEAIGLIIEYLQAKGVLENTMVVFTSDHGDMLYSHRWPNNKGRPEQESVRVPLMISWPEGLDAGIQETPIGTLDLMPTILGLMDIHPPASCQGSDLSRLIIRGRELRRRKVPIYNHQHNWRGVYSRRYTYAFCTDPAGDPEILPHSDTVHSRFVLYDRKRDHWEMRNLYHQPGYAMVRKRLASVTSRWMSETGDPDMPYRKIAGIIRKSSATTESGWPAIEGEVIGVPSALIAAKRKE
jgi:arylsulfatase A-like enzyme